MKIERGITNYPIGDAGRLTVVVSLYYILHIHFMLTFKLSFTQRKEQAMNFVFDPLANLRLNGAMPGHVHIAQQAQHAKEEIDANGMVAKEVGIDMFMPHAVGAANNVIEALEEVGRSFQDKRQVIVTNPNTKDWMNPAKNFLPG
jgi:hypothetical protein